jgi:hypothetical protein
MKTTALSIFALLASAGTAMAQTNGDIIFTDTVNGPSGTSSNFVKWWQTGGGGVSTIFTYANAQDPSQLNRPTTRLSDLTFGPNGSVFVGNGPSQVGDGTTNTVGNIFRIDNPFSGAATSSTLVTGGDVQNPIGLWYDTAKQRLVYTNNPTEGPLAGQNKGVYAMDNGGATTRLFAEPPIAAGLPRPANNAFVVPSPQGNGDYYVVSTNGGKFLVPQGSLPANRNFSSQVYRFGFGANPAPDSGTYSLTVDFADIGPTLASGNLPAPLDAFTNPFGDGTLPQVLTDVRGITTGPSGNLFVTDQLTGGIYEITLNGVGGYGSIRTVTTGLSSPEAIAYDPYSNTLVFAEHTGPSGPRIARINLDGSGLSTVVADVWVRGIRIVPTPGAAALIGLGGLVALRRRRA